MISCCSTTWRLTSQVIVSVGFRSATSVYSRSGSLSEQCAISRITNLTLVDLFERGSRGVYSGRYLSNFWIRSRCDHVWEGSRHDHSRWWFNRVGRNTDRSRPLQSARRENSTPVARSFSRKVWSFMVIDIFRLSAAVVPQIRCISGRVRTISRQSVIATEKYNRDITRSGLFFSV